VYIIPRADIIGFDFALCYNGDALFFLVRWLSIIHTGMRVSFVRVCGSSMGVFVYLANVV
jgi:hypothetical protein